MKLVRIAWILLWCIGLFSCKQSSQQQGQTANELLPAEAFQQQLQKAQAPQLIDVRTPEEFATGHIAGAVNMDYNSDDFEAQIAKLDKSQPVFVYCLSGGRSGSAAALMQELGFAKVYGLDKGMMAWRQANLPVETADTQAEPAAGMSMEEFTKQVTRDKLVLVDYNAVWCGPCKKMLPVLKKLEEANKDKLVLFPVDADENPDLIKHKQIEGIPHLELYRQGKLVWTYTGFVSEQDLLTSIQPNL
jgi:rhodanese-related sulfurtransferase